MRGPSSWKINSSLMEDEDYVSAINEEIPEWLSECNKVTDKRVLWDLIKYRVRQFTIKCSKDKARKRKQRLVEIETSLEEAEEALRKNSSTSNFENLENLKMEYDSHFDYMAKGVIIRSRAKWYEHG